MNQHWFQSEFIKANVNKVSQLLLALLCLRLSNLSLRGRGSLCGVLCAAPCDVMAMPCCVVSAHATVASYSYLLQWGVVNISQCQPKRAS